MSEEKMYAIKNDDGEWSDDSGAFYPEKKNGIGFIFTMFSDRDEATGWAERNTNGGHIVTLIEEPKKVVLTKEQAKIVDDAHSDGMPAGYIFSKSNDEELLINAYVNGYTVAKEKKYRVKVPETQTSYYYKGSDGHVHASDTSGDLDNEFSYSELQQYGLDGERFTKEEVTDDGE